MYLAEFRIHGYKSFLDSGPIRLRPGFNILTGQNNAGKTALLEALSLQFNNKPHRSLSTAPTPASTNQPSSRALLGIAITQQELSDALNRLPNAMAAMRISTAEFKSYEKAWEIILRQREVVFDIGFAPNPGHSPAYTITDPKQFFPDYAPDANFFFLTLKSDGKGGILPGSSDKPSYAINARLGQQLLQGIYCFRAERMNIGRSKFGSERELRPDASNLPEVLHVLQSTNPARFKRYNKLAKQVFPQVEWISSRPQGSDHVEIFVWPIDPDTERADLAVPLSESGTGISQVLAMLYVLVTADTPRTIIIDEPNSFLHPGAVRVLVDILRDHSNHQYIITTHSPELISASNPSTVHVLRRSQGQTQVNSIDTREARQLRELLAEVGSRFSDVFGAENVLWVEGPTEQFCYPLIARKVLNRSLVGVTIVGVLHTGDFDAKTDTKSVFRIYERLTQGSALLPPAIAFIFDRELRPERDRKDLERQSRGKVHFLARRTYENYLLHPEAIAAVLNQNPPFTEEPASPEKVKSWLDEHWEDIKYYGKIKSQNQVQDIDAPKILGDLFSEFSTARLEYNKVEHSIALTEWLIEHAPEQLKELADILAKVLPSPS